MAEHKEKRMIRMTLKLSNAPPLLTARLLVPAIKPTVPEVLPAVIALYERPGGGAGCCLHVVLDDNNVEDNFVKYALERATERGHSDCIALARTLTLMSRTQRLKLGKLKAKGV